LGASRVKGADDSDDAFRPLIGICRIFLQLPIVIFISDINVIELIKSQNRLFTKHKVSEFLSHQPFSIETLPRDRIHIWQEYTDTPDQCGHSESNIYTGMIIAILIFAPFPKQKSCTQFANLTDEVNNIIVRYQLKKVR